MWAAWYIIRKILKYGLVFCAGALAMYLYLWWDVLHDFEKVWEKIYIP